MTFLCVVYARSVVLFPREFVIFMSCAFSRAFDVFEETREREKKKYAHDVEKVPII